MKESSVAEQAAGDVEDSNELVAEANLQSKNDNEKSAEQAESDFQCDLCDFRSNWENGLNIHLARKHANIEQLDGGNDAITEDIEYERTKHYWKEGRMGKAYQTFLDVVDILENSDFDVDTIKEEKEKATLSRKKAFGENYLYFPPWDKK